MMELLEKEQLDIHKPQVYDDQLLTPIAYLIFSGGIQGTNIEESEFFGQQKFQEKKIIEYL